MPLTIQFVFIESPESKQRVKAMYNRIFTMAKQNLIAKKQNATVGKENKN